MRRETENLLLLLVGAAILVITLNGSYLRYVKAGLYPFLLAAGAGFVLLALIAIARDLRSGGRAVPHGHGRAPWLLLVPVLALLLIAPPALGSEVLVTGSAVRPAEPAAGAAQRALPSLRAGDAPRLQIVDLVNRAVWDTSGSLDGREVRISGFVARTGAEVDLVRVVISCCVADARYVYVHLAGLPQAVEDDTWIEVRGVVEPGSARRDPGLAPTVRVVGSERIEIPEMRYEYAR
ncbi:TIGR03943 family putative permease subunit [Nocardia harenae]|uniref:TIGR03943 family putative permease subunit n=1 Tax=Nocardia harenae TaxID=358707 RepID=UPI0008336696|nr:TIGR03943 family protein [Nocardia harenae]